MEASKEKVALLLKSITKSLVLAYGRSDKEVNSFWTNDYISGQFKAEAMVKAPNCQKYFSAYGKTSMLAVKNLARKINRDLRREIRMREQARKLL